MLPLGSASPSAPPPRRSQGRARYARDRRPDRPKTRRILARHFFNNKWIFHIEFGAIFGAFSGRPGGGDSARKEREGGAEATSDARQATGDASHVACRPRACRVSHVACHTPPRPAFRPVRLARPRIGSDSGGDGSGRGTAAGAGTGARLGRRRPTQQVGSAWNRCTTGRWAASGAGPGKADAPSALATVVYGGDEAAGVGDIPFVPFRNLSGRMKELGLA